MLKHRKCIKTFIIDVKQATVESMDG